jgi:drug/metabolite transporter (DMT)-like permease
MTAESRGTLVGTLFVLGAIASWGSYFPFAKIILGKLSPVAFLVFRLGIGGAVLILLSLRLHKSFSIARRDWLIVISAAAVGIIIHQIIQLTGLIYTTAANTGWILTLIPPATGLLAWLFLKEQVGWRQIVGLAVAAFGVLLFVSQGRLGELSFIENYGDILALLSVFSWSVYTILTKLRLGTYHPLPISAIHMVIGFMFFLLIGAWSIPDQVGNLRAIDWVIIVLIGIIPSGLAYYWWNSGLQRLSAMNTTMFVFIQAIITTTLGFYLLGESITLLMIGFAAIIIVGVSFAQYRRRPRVRSRPGAF